MPTEYGLWRVETTFIIEYMSALPEELLNLSVEDRLQLLDQLWESIRQQPDSLPLTDEQRSELDRRLEEHQRHPEAAQPWPAVMEKIRDRT
jgi:putative addiction module component (TIGR02574 family)